MRAGQGHGRVARVCCSKKGDLMLTGTDLGQIRGIITLYPKGMIWGSPKNCGKPFTPVVKLTNT